jgi:hypothetical protein
MPHHPQQKAYKQPTGKGILNPRHCAMMKFLEAQPVGTRGDGVRLWGPCACPACPMMNFHDHNQSSHPIGTQPVGTRGDGVRLWGPCACPACPMMNFHDHNQSSHPIGTQPVGTRGDGVRLWGPCACPGPCALKRLSTPPETLRYAQADNSLPILIVKLHYRASRLPILHTQQAPNRSSTNVPSHLPT